MVWCKLYILRLLFCSGAYRREHHLQKALRTLDKSHYLVRFQLRNADKKMNRYLRVPCISPKSVELIAPPNGPELSCGGEAPQRWNLVRVWQSMSDKLMFRACKIIDGWFRQLSDWLASHITNGFVSEMDIWNKNKVISRTIVLCLSPIRIFLFNGFDE